MHILAIESSCDETAAAVSLNGRTILSDAIYSQADIHALYGGVVPEIASRRHAEKISLVAEAALRQAGIALSDIDAVAATCAPGLIGALLVGANFAKACALSLGVPFIPVHHIRAHVAAAYIAFPDLQPPFTALVASGGHTLILDVRNYTDLVVIGTTRDDAAGEAFDKTARLLGLPYPGGAALDALARQGAPGRYKLPRAGVTGSDWDFSFSGLKTAAVNLIHNANQKGDPLHEADLALEIASAVADTLVPRTLAAALEYKRPAIVAAGGVAANSTLRGRLEAACAEHGLRLCLPPLSLCGDNGSMIAAQAYFEHRAGNAGAMDQNCYATLPVDARLHAL